MASGRRVGRFARRWTQGSLERVVPGDGLREALEQLVRLDVTSPIPPFAREGEKEGVPSEAPGLPIRWTFPADQDAAPISALVSVDLNGDQRPELLMARGNKVICLNADGTTAWEYALPATATALCVAPAAEQPRGTETPRHQDTRTPAHGSRITDHASRIIYAGCDDEHLYVLTPSGQLVTQHHVDVPLRVGTSSVSRPRIRTILAGDLERDGPLDLIVGTANGNLCRFDRDFNLLWRVDTIEHGTIQGQLRDLDGDGKLEILVGNKYGSVEVFDATGRQIGDCYSELGDVEFDVGNLDGDGTLEVVNGSSTGALRTSAWDGTTKWNFDNYGYAAFAVRVADVDGDGTPEATVASETGYVYLLDGAGKVKAQHNLGDAQRALAVADVDGDGHPEIVTGGDDRHVTVLDGQARIRAAQDLPDYVVGLWAADLDGDGAAEILAATTEGTLYALNVKRET
jgi:hypothetical protein